MSLQNICRLCAKQTNFLIDLFREEGLRHKIGRKVRLCLEVTIREDDALSKKICVDCLYKVDLCYEMRAKYKEAQLIVQKVADKGINAEFSVSQPTGESEGTPIHKEDPFALNHYLSRHPSINISEADNSDGSEPPKKLMCLDRSSNSNSPVGVSGLCSETSFESGRSRGTEKQQSTLDCKRDYCTTRSEMTNSSKTLSVHSPTTNSGNQGTRNVEPCVGTSESTSPISGVSVTDQHTQNIAPEQQSIAKPQCHHPVMTTIQPPVHLYSQLQVPTSSKSVFQTLQVPSPSVSHTEMTLQSPLQVMMPVSGTVMPPFAAVAPVMTSLPFAMPTFMYQPTVLQPGASHFPNYMHTVSPQCDMGLSTLPLTGVQPSPELQQQLHAKTVVQKNSPPQEPVAAPGQFIPKTPSETLLPSSKSHTHSELLQQPVCETEKVSTEQHSLKTTAQNPSDRILQQFPQDSGTVASTIQQPELPGNNEAFSISYPSQQLHLDNTRQHPKCTPVLQEAPTVSVSESTTLTGPVQCQSLSEIQQQNELPSLPHQTVLGNMDQGLKPSLTSMEKMRMFRKKASVVEPQPTDIVKQSTANSKPLQTLHHARVAPSEVQKQMNLDKVNKKQNEGNSNPLNQAQTRANANRFDEVHTKVNPTPFDKEENAVDLNRETEAQSIANLNPEEKALSKISPTPVSKAQNKPNPNPAMEVQSRVPPNPSNEAQHSVTSNPVSEAQTVTLNSVSTMQNRLNQHPISETQTPRNTHSVIETQNRVNSNPDSEKQTRMNVNLSSMAQKRVNPNPGSETKIQKNTHPVDEVQKRMNPNPVNEKQTRMNTNLSSMMQKRVNPNPGSEPQTHTNTHPVGEAQKRINPNPVSEKQTKIPNLTNMAQKRVNPNPGSEPQIQTNPNPVSRAQNKVNPVPPHTVNATQGRADLTCDKKISDPKSSAVKVVLADVRQKFTSEQKNQSTVVEPNAFTTVAHSQTPVRLSCSTQLPQTRVSASRVEPTCAKAEAGILVWKNDTSCTPSNKKYLLHKIQKAVHNALISQTQDAGHDAQSASRSVSSCRSRSELNSAAIQSVNSSSDAAISEHCQTVSESKSTDTPNPTDLKMPTSSATRTSATPNRKSVESAFKGQPCSTASSVTESNNNCQVSSTSVSNSVSECILVEDRDLPQSVNFYNQQERKDSSTPIEINLCDIPDDHPVSCDCGSCQAEITTTHFGITKTGGQVTCSVCKKKFPANIIERHQNLHWGVNFYSCLSCSKDFITEDEFNNHIC